MANEGNKKRLAANAAFMKTHTMILLIVNAIYLAYRVGLHFASFSGWHWVGLAFTSFVYLLTYYLLRESAKPRYAPLNDGGALLSGGEDMDAQGGVIEYTRDMLYVTAFIQLATGFVRLVLAAATRAAGDRLLLPLGEGGYPWISSRRRARRTPEGKKRRSSRKGSLRGEFYAAE